MDSLDVAYASGLELTGWVPARRLEDVVAVFPSRSDMMSQLPPEAIFGAARQIDANARKQMQHFLFSEDGYAEQDERHQCREQRPDHVEGDSGSNDRHVVCRHGLPSASQDLAPAALRKLSGAS